MDRQSPHRRTSNLNPARRNRRIPETLEEDLGIALAESYFSYCDHCEVRRYLYACLDEDSKSYFTQPCFTDYHDPCPNSDVDCCEDCIELAPEILRYLFDPGYVFIESRVLYNVALDILDRKIKEQEEFEFLDR